MFWVLGFFRRPPLQSCSVERCGDVAVLMFWDFCSLRQQTFASSLFFPVGCVIPFQKLSSDNLARIGHAGSSGASQWNTSAQLYGWEHHGSLEGVSEGKCQVSCGVGYWLSLPWQTLLGVQSEETASGVVELGTNCNAKDVGCK